MAPWWLHSQTDQEHRTDKSASVDASTSVAPKAENTTSSSQVGSDESALDSANPRRRVTSQPSDGGADSQTGTHPEEPPRRRRRGRRGKSKRTGLKPGTEVVREPAGGKSRAGATPQAAIQQAVALGSKVSAPKAPESKALEAKAPKATIQEPTDQQPTAQRPTAKKETVRHKPNAEKRGKKTKNGNSRQGVITAADIIPDFEEPTSELEDEVESPLHHPESVGSLGNGVIFLPERGPATDERKIAMFVDFENIALGVRDSEIKTFDIGLFMERLLEKGKIIVKRAYADWERYNEFKRPLHEAAIELIDIPQKYYSGKNSADIKMVVDAMDLCYSKEHLDTFVLVSGDSDFSPLVSKLKENDKYVMGLGVKNASSHLLIDNCDEFIFYEDVWRDSQKAPRLDHLPKKEADCFLLMSEAILALLRENKDVLWGSMIKQTMKRKRPSFNEGYYGYSTFSELLQDAERKKIIRLRRDRRSGGFVVLGFASSKG